jgi:spore coat protein U-like protein
MRGMKACFLAAFFLCVALVASPAFAAGSNTLSLAATVVGTCKVTTAPATLDFLTIDPSGSSAVTATTSFSMKCTKSTVSTAASDNGGLNFSSGTKRMKHSVTATAFLPYAVTYSDDTGFTGQGFGGAAGAQTVTVTGIITPAQFQNALVTTGVQLYSDTVTITVNP